jgi:hypothetical protein
MKTKTRLQFLALTASLVLVGNIQAQSVSVPIIKVAKGSTGSVALSLVAGGGATNFDFTMTYDATVVDEAAISFTCDPATVGLTSLTCAVDKTKNQIKGIGVNLSSTVLASGAFAAIDLPVLASAAIGSSVNPINENFATETTVTPLDATWTLNVDIAANVDNELRNIATRAEVRTGNEILIGGFVIRGDTKKCVVVQGLGGSVGVPDGVTRLGDPVLELKSGLTTIASNDNWQVQDNPSDVQAIENAGWAPKDIMEAAIYKCLDPGAYTALVTGFNNTTGVGMVAVYDADDGASYLRNIATRSWVGTSHAISIAGFVIKGDTPKQILIRGLGPSMESKFPPNSPLLWDPLLRLYRGPDLIVSNDDWGDAANAAEIGALPAPLPPTHNKEPAILITLEPGLYTAHLRGVGTTTGIGNVAVYDLTGRQ